MDISFNKYYIYIHTTLDTNEVFYIGKGCANRAYDQDNRSKKWKSIVNKHGRKVEVVLENLSEEQSLIQERLGQMDLKPRANIAICGGKGGNGGMCKGIRWSKVSREKHRKSMKDRNLPAWNKGIKGSIRANVTTFTSENSSGENNSFYGKKHTDEARLLISAASRKRKGISRAKVTCPHCQKIGGSNLMKRYHFNNCKKNSIGE